MNFFVYFFYVFAFLFFHFGHMLHFFEHKPMHKPMHKPKKNPLFSRFFVFWGRGLSAISTPNKRCQIKGLPLVCTILSSSPRMAPAHRFWAYGHILPQKTLVTKISVYLGSLVALPRRNKSAN